MAAVPRARLPQREAHAWVWEAGATRAVPSQVDTGVTARARCTRHQHSSSHHPGGGRTRNTSTPPSLRSRDVSRHVRAAPARPAESTHPCMPHSRDSTCPPPTPPRHHQQAQRGSRGRPPTRLTAPWPLLCDACARNGAHSALVSEASDSGCTADPSRFGQRANFTVRVVHSHRTILAHKRIVNVA